MAGTTIDSDDHLVTRAGEGDSEALATLLDRHLHPAWRIALAASPTTVAAEEAVVVGFCDALNAAGRHPDPTISMRTRIAAAVHAACLAADRPDTRRAPEGADPVRAAFATLPVASRTALWLTVVEGGDAAQAAPVLGVERGVAFAMANRAASTLRKQVNGDLAIVRPALRKLVTPVPATLPAAVAERWAETGGRDRAPAVRRFNQRLVGAAAAAVVALGLAGALLFGGGGSGAGPQLAAPAAAVDLSDLAETPTTAALAAPALPTAPPALASSGAGRSPEAVDRPRSAAPAPAPAPAPTTTSTAPPATTTSTTTPPSTTTTSTTAPPTYASSNPTTTTTAPPVTVVVPDEPGEQPVIEVELPGLDTIEIPLAVPVPLP